MPISAESSTLKILGTFKNNDKTKDDFIRTSRSHLKIYPEKDLIVRNLDIVPLPNKFTAHMRGARKNDNL